MLYDVWIAMSNAISTSTATGSVNQSRLIISKKPSTVPDRENKAVVTRPVQPWHRVHIVAVEPAHCYDP